jgi:hypothetical protein
VGRDSLADEIQQCFPMVMTFWILEAIVVFHKLKDEMASTSAAGCASFIEASFF